MFIDNASADELSLPVTTPTKSRLHTFGTEQVTESKSRRVVQDIWDKDGNSLSLNLFTHEILYYSSYYGKGHRLCARPESFLHVHTAKPTVELLIFLGSDQLWSLVRIDQPISSYLQSYIYHLRILVIFQ